MKGNIGIFSTLGALAVGASLVTIPAAASASVTSKSTPNLSGYTLNVGDISNQLELQLVESGEITPLSSGSSTFTVKGFPFQVSFTQFPAGPEVLAGIEGGSLQFGVTTDTAMIFAQQAGLPIKTVAVTIPQKPGALFSIVTSAKSGISSVAGLKGKTVAVQTGTVNEYLLLSALEKAKLKYTQVTEDNLTSPNGLAALKNGAVDAAVLQEPYVSLAKLAGYKVITSGAGYVQGYQALDAPTSALNDPKTSAAIGDFLTLLDGAEVWNKSHSAQAIADIVKQYGVPTAFATTLHADSEPVFTTIGSAVEKATQTEEGIFFGAGELAKNLNTNSIYSTVYNAEVAKFPKI